MMNAELVANDTMVRCPLHVFTFKLLYHFHIIVTWRCRGTM